MRTARICLLALALAGLMASGTAQAADPESGTLSSSSKSVKWSGSFVLSEPNPNADCLGGSEDPTCDYFYLNVNLPDRARVTVTVPSPDSTTDLDLNVYNATGGLVGSSGNAPGETEMVTFRHSGRYTNKPYEVRVSPWLVVPGTTYEASASAL